MRMADSISSLPYYEQWAPGALSPTDRQITVNWWAHMTKDLVILGAHLSPDNMVYLLSRQRHREEPGHFHVIGVLWEVEVAHDKVWDMIVAWTEEKQIDEIRRWQQLPVFADVVYHVEPRTLHLRYREEWDGLSDAMRASLETRASVLKGVPSPITSFCLGADALSCLYKLSTVLGLFARALGLGEDRKMWAAEYLQKTLADMGLHVSLTGMAEWSVAEPDEGQRENAFGFARAKVAHPDAQWAAVDWGVVCYGLEFDGRMHYLAVTKGGALSDQAVNTYNKTNKNAIASEKGEAEQVEDAREFLTHKWPLFAAPPPGPVCFPRRPELRKHYVLGLTKFAKLLAIDNPVETRRHPQGCLCPWITKDKELLDCTWCGSEKYNGPKQFCDHIFGQKHQRRCDTGLLMDDNLTEAVEAVEQATEDEQQKDYQAWGEVGGQDEAEGQCKEAEGQGRWEDWQEWQGTNTWWEDDGQGKSDPWWQAAGSWSTLDNWYARWHWKEASGQWWSEDPKWQAQEKEFPGQNWWSRKQLGW